MTIVKLDLDALPSSRPVEQVTPEQAAKSEELDRALQQTMLNERKGVRKKVEAVVDSLVLTWF